MKNLYKKICLFLLSFFIIVSSVSYFELKTNNFQHQAIAIENLINSTIDDESENETDFSETEICTYGNETEKYKQDSGHMIYFAVYFLDTFKEDKNEEFYLDNYPAPQTSFEGNNYDEEKSNSSSVVCKMTYAEKDFYMYDAGAIGHNREYEQINMFVTKNVEPPKVEVLTSKNGYSYLGYTYKLENTKKYSSSQTLKHANSKSELTGTDTKINHAGIGLDEFYCITISVYFYRPTSVKLVSNDSNLGRFSLDKNATFQNSYKSLGDYEISQGLLIDIVNNNTNEPNYLFIHGNYTIVENGEKKTLEKSKKIYIIPNQNCYQIKSGNLKNYLLDTRLGEEFMFYFTQKSHNLTFKILSNVQTSENLEIDFSFGLYRQKATLTSGKNIQKSITIESIPENYPNNLTATISSSDETKHYILSTTPLEIFSGEINKNFVNLSNIFSLSDDETISEIVLYIYELFDINIITRNEKYNFNQKYYKIYGIDFDFDNLPKNINFDEFTLFDYSIDEKMLSTQKTLTDETATSIYANWKKTISANIFSRGTNEPRQNTYSKIIYNFSTIDEIEISESEFPKEPANFYCYSTDYTKISKSDEFENKKSLKANQTLYAFYKDTIELNYNYSSFSGENPNGILENFYQEIFNSCYENSTGLLLKITDIKVSKQYFDFIGWAETSGGNESNCLTSGDEIFVTFGEAKNLYANFTEHKYIIQVKLNGGTYLGKNGVVDETTKIITLQFSAGERLYVDSSTFSNFGYKISSFSAQNHPEKIQSNCYDNIDDDDFLTIKWESQKYKISLSVSSICESSELDAEINLTYQYFDSISNENISKSEIFKRSNLKYNKISLEIPANIVISFTATIDIDNYNLAFNNRTNEVNKTANFQFNFNNKDDNEIIIYLTRAYKINLIYEENSVLKNKIIYKYINTELELPENLAKKDGYEQIFWSESSDENSTKFKKIKANLNEEKTLYAVFSMYAKFFIFNTETPDYQGYYSIGDSYGYTGGNLVGQIIKNGISYKFKGYTDNPNNCTVKTNGTNLIFEKSVCWYAVWGTDELSTTISENVTLNFDTKSEIKKVPIVRTIKYSNYTTYANIDFTNFDNSNYVNGTKEYSNGKIDFVSGSYKNSNKTYLIYGWNNSGKITDKCFTEEDNILIEENLNFYAIFREDITYNVEDVTHCFYFRGKNPVTRTTKAYTRSNTFNIFDYNLFNTKQVCDNKTYETTYDNLTFDELLAYHFSGTEYKFLGWGLTPKTAKVVWTKDTPELEVRGISNWYAIFSYTHSETKTENLTHTFVAGEDLTFNLSTTKTTTFKNVVDYITCQERIRMSNGEIKNIEYDSIDFSKTPTFDIEKTTFLGWSTSNSSFEIEFSESKSLFTPENETTFYPIFSFDMTFEIVVNVSGTYSTTWSDFKEVLTNFDFSKFNIETFEMKVGTSLYLDKEKFTGFIESSMPEKIYKTGETYTFSNLKKKNTVYFYTLLKDTEIFDVIVTSDSNTITYNVSSGEKFELKEPNTIEGKVFKHYTFNGKNYNIGDLITITSNSEIVAVYENENEDNAINNTKTKNHTATIIVICIITAIAVAIIIFVLIKYTNIFKKKNKKQNKK